METLHKLAGVTETSDQHTLPSQPIPDPPPIPQDEDTEGPNDASRRASRASLPLNRQPSHKSFRSSKHRSRSQSRNRSERHSPVDVPADYPPVPTSAPSRPSHESARTGVTGSEEEFVWGPGHPCFPHPNPHCAPDSEEYRNTRVIRVRRDWLQAGDLYPQYANLYPEILDPLVTDDDFRYLISNINARLQATFSPYTTRSYLDTALSVATGFLWDDLGFTGSKRGMTALEAFIDKWNRDKESEGKEVRVVQVRRTGFMVLDFVVPDPGIEVAAESEGGIGPAE